MYQQEWNARVAAGTTDNAANRGIFLIEKTVGFWKEIYEAGSIRENQINLPPPDTMELNKGA